MRPMRELFAYTGAAATAFAVDIGLLHALVRTAGWHYLVAASVSFTCATTLLYALSTRFVFRHRRLDSRALEFGGFAAIGAAGLALNAAMLWVAVGRYGLALLPAKVGVAGVTFFTNFGLRRLLLFTPGGTAALVFDKRSHVP